MNTPDLFQKIDEEVVKVVKKVKIKFKENCLSKEGIEIGIIVTPEIASKLFSLSSEYKIDLSFRTSNKLSLSMSYRNKYISTLANFLNGSVGKTYKKEEYRTYKELADSKDVTYFDYTFIDDKVTPIEVTELESEELVYLIPDHYQIRINTNTPQKYLDRNIIIYLDKSVFELFYNETYKLKNYKVNNIIRTVNIIRPNITFDIQYQDQIISFKEVLSTELYEFNPSPTAINIKHLPYYFNYHRKSVPCVLKKELKKEPETIKTNISLPIEVPKDKTEIELNLKIKVKFDNNGKILSSEIV